MVTCSICYERFTAPVSLPCGHLFCRECVRRTVESHKSSGSENLCPTCRAPYSILKVDPALVPPYLRPHILPPIRPVFFDHPTPTSASISAPASTSAPELSVMPPSSLHHELTTMAPAPTPTEIAAAAAAELHTLRLACMTWRRRAETHAAVNTRLLAFARGARDCALRMRAERDIERNNYVLLKRKLSDLG
ncbi:hypothetical protein B0H11DRAFT_1728468 [Mycena galericulata]|nr:hypothetical protein B0H11DRAFT_1728468 [Mycena galericulata]